MRLFVAAELPADLRGRFEGLQRELREAPLPVRWVKVDGIHLTLKFLGEVAGSRLDEITTAVDQLRSIVVAERARLRCRRGEADAILHTFG